MAVEVREIMNHELFSVRADERVGDVRHYLVALGVSAAPVIDRHGRPCGFITLRELAEAPEHAHVASRMSAPVDTVEPSATIEQAARLMSARSHHHLVCVDDEGRAIGFVGALDVLRGLIGQPAPHPESFPHYDAVNGLTWSNESQLTFAAVEYAPDGPGVFVLIDAAPQRPNRLVWSEATDHVRRRLRDMISTPGTAPPHLMDAAVSGRLWFRCAPVTPALPQRGAA
jgi:CBS domain-containing protein